MRLSYVPDYGHGYVRRLIACSGLIKPGWDDIEISDTFIGYIKSDNITYSIETPRGCIEVDDWGDVDGGEEFVGALEYGDERTVWEDSPLGSILPTVFI